MPIGYHSESLNNLLSNQPSDYQKQIKNWWGNKMKLAFVLMGGFGVLGVILGLTVNVASPCIGYVTHG